MKGAEVWKYYDKNLLLVCLIMIELKILTSTAALLTIALYEPSNNCIVNSDTKLSSNTRKRKPKSTETHKHSI